MEIQNGTAGQSVIEYAVLLAAVCAVIVSMQVYAKRAVQGRLKQGIDMVFHRTANAAQGKTGRGEEQQKIESEPGEVGSQFSPKWSNFTVIATSHQRSRNTLSTSGERVVTLLDHAVTRLDGVVKDDFSDKTLTDEALFE